ncbi:MAG: aldehyde dehydrogenase family protein, partial [Cytophagia bacterium]|nr:aldehyde dehydrogenase family protein [Cytophagia bacterium]
MNNANFNFERPENEPILSYRAGTKERKLLIAEMERMSSEVIDIPLIIGGKEIRTGNTGKVVMPHNHKHILATYHKAGEKEVQMAIDASMKAHKAWEGLSWIERVSITLKVADLISKKY